MVDRKAFLSLLSKRLYPVLRAEGFKDSGTTLHRVNGPVIHVFNFQGSSSGNTFYLNLGAHLSFLAPEGESGVQPEKMMESGCVFRERMHPPTGPQFGWAYCDTMEQALENIEFIVSEWPSQGQAFFEQYRSFPESFAALISQTMPSSIHPARCRYFARIAAELGRIDAATDFARSGLLRIGERASGARINLEKMLAQYESLQA